MVTWIAPVGATVERGEPLYALDGQPTILLYGSVPQHRTLRFEPRTASHLGRARSRRRPASEAAELTLSLEEERLADARRASRTPRPVSTTRCRRRPRRPSSSSSPEPCAPPKPSSTASSFRGRSSPPPSEIAAAEAELAAARATLDAAIRALRKDIAAAGLDAATARVAVAEAR